MNAPDLIEPVIGFRAWHPQPDGLLVPWSVGWAGAWRPGVNTATCQRPGIGHAAPAHDCSCGLYALADPRDHRLNARSLAVGAIVAWGDMEVHRTGFRAQHACVVALARPDGGEHLQTLRVAAARYGVPLVPKDRLLEVALEHGQRLSFDALPQHRRPRPSAPSAPLLVRGGPLGTAIDDHVHVELDVQKVSIRLTSQLAGALTAGVGVSTLPAAPTPVRRGDTVATASAGADTIVIRSPVSGLVTTRAGATAASWRLGLVPTRWEDDAQTLVWGERGLRVYAAQHEDARRRGDAFASVRARWLRANAHVTSATDVLRELRAARHKPRFADAQAVRLRIAMRLQAALEDPTVARHLSRMPMRIAWRLHEPEVDIVVDLAASPATVRTDVSTDGAQLVLYTSAELADEWFAGRLDLPAAVRRREVQTGASLSELLRVASVLTAMQQAYARQAGGSIRSATSIRPRRAETE